MPESTPNTQFDNYRPRVASPQKKSWSFGKKFGLVLFILLLIVAAAGAYEVKTSHFQSRFLHEYAKTLTYQQVPFESDKVIYPKYGPFDNRHGYSNIPEYLARLKSRGFAISQQTYFSPALMHYTELGFFPPYHEKAQSGFSIQDCRAQTIFNAKYPQRAYGDSDVIPSEIVNTLLFIENRELWNKEPNHNPVIDWPRFVLAAMSQISEKVGVSMSKAGGSTLATQIEKFRHSEHGLTSSIEDKLLQIGSGMVRVYQQGENTTAARQRIVQDYLNTVPLSSAPGFGEVNGIGDGLWAWFKTDFDQANRLLLSKDPNRTAERGQVFRQIVALMIAQRRPSYYLLQGHNDLEELVDSHLRLLVSYSLIEPQLMSSAMQQKLKFDHRRVFKTNTPNKGVNAVRVRTANMLGNTLYDLDRLDLSVTSTIHGDLQQQVSEYIRKLATPQFAQQVGLMGERLLTEQQLPNVLYSFTLYEKTESENKVRIQTDSTDQPFDINEGSKLELGSTAKLRVLATYLDIIAELQQRFIDKTVADLYVIQREVEPKDAITRWVVDYLIETRDRNLTRMLEAALQRRYSASADEKFFTGGGLHVFSNFKKKENDRIPTLYEALQDSVNLPFVRLMQDIVRYSSSHNNEGSMAQLLRNDKDPRREEYLKAFAKREGSQFVRRFYRKYKPLASTERQASFYQGIQKDEHKLSATYRYLNPYKDGDDLKQFLAQYLPQKTFTDRQINALYNKYGEDKFNLADQGYIARVHPLELWVLSYLNTYPEASLQQVLEDSQPQLQAVYRWLFKTRHQNARDVRIQVMLEVEAFLSIHARWAKMGYPFDFIVPSLGSALGSSGDRPAALAELMGIIQNDGVRLITSRVDELHFAANTPYEVKLTQGEQAAVRAFRPEVARALKSALANVVDKGTARRLKGSLVDHQGVEIIMGGKTGTGDNRIATEMRNGKMVASTAMNRTATFVFYLGDNYFGTLTAFVPGAKADDFSFTSALPLQVLKGMMPILTPHLYNESTPFCHTTQQDE